MEFKFYPLEEFDYTRENPDGSKRLVARYFPGNGYNCTRQPVHDHLREQCKTWEAEGKIRIVPLDPGVQFQMNQVRTQDGDEPEAAPEVEGDKP
ncbi:MAG: hypothetical protein AAFY29_22795 [Pseudomonadota bacterium]